MQIALGIILLVAAVFLIIAVLLQNGKSKGLSGTISGGAETFFGKNKAKTIDKKLSVLTTVVAVIFVVITLVVFVSQDYVDIQKQANDYWSSIIESINKDKDSSSDTDSSDVDTATDDATDTATGTAEDAAAEGADEAEG
ncbi:MAG: preprotein translocase subunit SecG [Eubacteriales bacterium]